MQHIMLPLKLSKASLRQKMLATSLLLGVVLQPALCVGATAPVTAPALKTPTVEIRGAVSIGVKKNNLIKSLSLRDASIKDVLQSLAEQGEFNLIVDKSVEGTITIDLKNVTIQKLLEYILTLSDLTYYNDGKTFIVTSKQDGEKKALSKVVLKSLPINHTNALELANLMNTTIFSFDRPGGTKSAVATADPRTNSIIVMGSQEDVDLANRAIKELDFPLKHKTFFLKNAPAVEVANTISQTLFSVNVVPATAAGGGGASAAITNQPQQQQQQQQNPLAQQAQSGSAGAAGGVNQQAIPGLNAGYGLNSIQVLRGGPLTFIANQANNTLTMVGSAEQIALAEAMLYDVDIRPAQVAIQVSIISLSETKDNGVKSFMGSTTPEKVNIAGQSGGLSLSGKTATLFFGNSASIISGTLTDFWKNFGLQSSMSYSKGKVLANPTILTVSGSKASFNSDREVISGSTVTQSAFGGFIVTPEKTNVGITLDITPEVLNDGTVMLNLQPTVKAPVDTFSFASAVGVSNTLTLVSTNKLNIARARVKDGSSLVLAGLIQDNNTSTENRVPFLSNIPFVGGFFKPSQGTTRTRTELLVVVTPHIVKEDGVPYFRKEWKEQNGYSEKQAALGE
jgi:type II secretory pathway component GspD/PulD (secretin)